MIPAARRAAIIEDAFTRGLHVQSLPGQSEARYPAPTSAATPAAELEDRFAAAVTAAALAVANVDRVLRRQPAASSALDVHHQVLAACRAAVIEAVLSQHPAAVLEAIGDAGSELQVFVEKLSEEPDQQAVWHDPVLMKDACTAVVRALLTAYRKSLTEQLLILRSPDTVES